MEGQPAARSGRARAHVLSPFRQCHPADDSRQLRPVGPFIVRGVDSAPRALPWGIGSGPFGAVAVSVPAGQRCGSVPRALPVLFLACFRERHRLSMCHVSFYRQPQGTSTCPPALAKPVAHNPESVPSAPPRRAFLMLSPSSEKPSRVLAQPTGIASASNRGARASKTACSASSMLATATSMAAAAYSSARSAQFFQLSGIVLGFPLIDRGLRLDSTCSAPGNIGPRQTGKTGASRAILHSRGRPCYAEAVSVTSRRRMRAATFWPCPPARGSSEQSRER